MPFIMGPPIGFGMPIMGMFPPPILAIFIIC